MRAWFSHPEHMLLALVISLVLVGLARLPRFVAWITHITQQTRHTTAALELVQPQRSHAAMPPLPPALPAIVAGAATALAQPPGIERSIAYMQRRSPHDRYLLPLGWWRNRMGEADLIHTALVGETNHLLITGASDCGKDNLAWWMLLSLALVQRDPAQLQIAILDDKGLDFQPWRTRAHTWLLATESEQIPAAMRRLTAERRRRRQILERATVSKWDHYQGDDLPLLVVFISELSLLESAVRRERQRRERDRSLDLDLESWLNDELTSGRAFGIRYLIGMQTVTGMDMLWRSQIGVFLAGYQPDESQVKPNTGKTARQLVTANATPPNLIPSPPIGAGIFTVVSGDDATTVRSPYLSEAERRHWLACLPEKEPAEDALLSSLFDAQPVIAVVPTGDSDAWIGHSASANGVQKIAGLQTSFAASQSGFVISDLGFSATDIAEIGESIARGEKKTEVVGTMKG